MRTLKFDRDIGWYWVEEEWVTFELATFEPTKIEDLDYYNGNK